MLNLIRLEMKRMNWVSIALSFTLINAALIGILVLLGIEPEAAREFLASAEDIIMLIEMLVVAAFIIYASVLLSNMIIEEFKNKTISVLFMYPISRKKLLVAKLIIISFLTFIFIVSTMLIVYYSFSAFNTAYALTSVELSNTLIADYAVHIVVIAIATAGLSLIPLFFGMIKYSVPVTVVSSILIVSIMSSSVDTSGTNLFSFTIIPIALGAFGFLAATLVVGRAVKKDF